MTKVLSKNNNVDVSGFWQFLKKRTTIHTTSVWCRTNSKKETATPTIFFYIHKLMYKWHIVTSKIKDIQQILVFFVINHMVGKWKFSIIKKFWALELTIFGTFLSKQQTQKKWAIFKSILETMAKCP